MKTIAEVPCQKALVAILRKPPTQTRQVVVQEIALMGGYGIPIVEKKFPCLRTQEEAQRLAVNEAESGNLALYLHIDREEKTLKVEQDEKKPIWETKIGNNIFVFRRGRDTVIAITGQNPEEIREVLKTARRKR